MPVSKLELIFQQWKASLPNRDKSKGAPQRNFEELFDDLKTEGMTSEEAHEWLPKIIKAHYPTAGHIKNAYNKNKHFGKWSNEKELEDQWKQDIENSAETAYFDVYPIETKQKKEKEAPKVYGNMSAEEYKLTREHAESYPEIDWNAISQQHEESQEAISEMDNLDELIRKADESK